MEKFPHNFLEDEDKENAIRKLWESGKYTNKAELASRVGMSREWIEFILKIRGIRENLGILETPNIVSPRSLQKIQTLPLEEQRQIIKKIKAKQLKQGQELKVKPN